VNYQQAYIDYQRATSIVLTSFGMVQKPIMALKIVCSKPKMSSFYKDAFHILGTKLLFVIDRAIYFRYAPDSLDCS
jgi:hypothetical protein